METLLPDSGPYIVLQNSLVVFRFHNAMNTVKTSGASGGKVNSKYQWTSTMTWQSHFPELYLKKTVLNQISSHHKQMTLTAGDQWKDRLTGLIGTDTQTQRDTIQCSTESTQTWDTQRCKMNIKRQNAKPQNKQDGTQQQQQQRPQREINNHPDFIRPHYIMVTLARET